MVMRTGGAGSSESLGSRWSQLSITRAGTTPAVTISRSP